MQFCRFFIIAEAGPPALQLTDLCRFKLSAAICCRFFVGAPLRQIRRRIFSAALNRRPGGLPLAGQAETQSGEMKIAPKAGYFATGETKSAPSLPPRQIKTALLLWPGGKMLRKE